MKRLANGLGLFYTRDSGGEHDQSVREYLLWASRRATELGVTFTCTPETLDRMIRDGLFAAGDLFIDWGIGGNIIARRGWDALRARILSDLRASHVFVPRRDRVARPDDAWDGIRMETELRRAGVTVVLMNRVLAPLRKGQRFDRGEALLAYLEYDEAGTFRPELAQKIIHAHIALAKQGYATGGRPCFGFRRWLATEDGTPVRQLEEGEHIRMARHHVVWLPGPERELKLIRRILAMLETMPARKVAAVLNAEGIPSPDSQRCRTDNGIKHKVSGLWHSTTINNIARNPLLVAVARYGQRALGDTLRMTPSGPRALSEADYREDEKPKVIRNTESGQIIAASRTKFEPVIPPEKFNELREILDRRGATQRGKPRAHDPSKNPLGCRIFDWNCQRPMYREPYSKSFRYKCSLYQQSNSQQCTHNHIDGPLAAHFALSCIRQRLLSPSSLLKLKAKLRQIAEDESRESHKDGEIAELRAQLSQVRGEFEKTALNLPRAQNDDQYQVIAADFERLKNDKAALEAKLLAINSASYSKSDMDAEVEAALKFAVRLCELADAQNLADAREAIELANVKLFVKFTPVQVKNRVLNKISGGVVTLGAAPPPFAPYEGPTSREKVMKVAQEADIAATGPIGRRSPIEPKPEGAGREGMSLGNVNRVFRTRLELFAAGVASWEPHVGHLLRAA